MPGIDFAPALPAEHGRAVAQDNLAGRALGAGRKISLRSRCHRGERVLLRARGATDVGDEFDRSLLEHRLEHRLLGWEVMIDRALGDACTGGDLVHRGPGKAALAEDALR